MPSVKKKISETKICCMGSEKQHPYSGHQLVKNMPIKVTLFNKQNMIWDEFVDILNSENQQ